MLGANINTVGWPACGEIDIMKQKGWDKNTISAVLHNLSSSGNTANTKETSVTGSTTGFHVYAVNWTAEKIEFSIDGVVFYTYNTTVKTNENLPYNASPFIILNLVMGGSLEGDIPADFTESKMEIDYVRIYRQKTS